MRDANADLPRRVQAFFDTAALSYDRAYAARGAAGRILRRRAEVVLDLLGDVPGTVLDIGMGAGFLCAELDRRRWRVTGVDVAPAMVEGARRRLPHLRERLIQGSIHAIPCADEYFDAVVATGVIEFAGSDLDGAVAELVRVLRPGGVAVVSFPNHRAPATIWRGRVLYPLVRAAKRILHADTPAPPRVPVVLFRGLRQALETAGLELTAIEPVGVRPAPPSIAARLEKSGSRLGRFLAMQFVVRASKPKPTH
jgi:ubiquinone/menaquinone biosynthesis C-methylase UbiE